MKENTSQVQFALIYNCVNFRKVEQNKVIFIILWCHDSFIWELSTDVLFCLLYRAYKEMCILLDSSRFSIINCKTWWKSVQPFFFLLSFYRVQPKDERQTDGAYLPSQVPFLADTELQSYWQINLSPLTVNKLVWLACLLFISPMAFTLDHVCISSNFFSIKAKFVNKCGSFLINNDQLQSSFISPFVLNISITVIWWN